MPGHSKPATTRRLHLGVLVGAAERREDELLALEIRTPGATAAGARDDRDQRVAELPLGTRLRASARIPRAYGLGNEALIYKLARFGEPFLT